MDWFEKLTGFREGAYEETQARLTVDGDRLLSSVNGRSYRIGRLDLLSLSELRAQADASAREGSLRVRNVSEDVRALHARSENRGALFQVASQFNLLEMIGPSVTPEQGVTRYAFDHTQGPACAIAAGAATIYRNYFAPLPGQIGQTADKQLDAAAELQQALAAGIGVSADRLWRMQNGYALPTATGLELVGDYLASIAPQTREQLKDRLRIGLHSEVEVTDGGSADQIVSQAFCSAMPVSYSGLGHAPWRPLAQLVLEASYEATLAAAVISGGRTGNSTAFLTRLGGGAFGNADPWIDGAIRQALGRYTHVALDVVFVSYGAIPGSLRSIKAEFS